MPRPEKDQTGSRAREIRLRSLIFLLFLFPGGLLAQQEYIGSKAPLPRADSAGGNLASIIFDKSFNTYHWNGTVLLNRRIGAVSVEMNEQFRSTLIRTAPKLITDNQYLDLKTKYAVSGDLRIGVDLNSFVLSDNKSISGGISNASSHAFYGGAAYRVSERFWLEPSVGVRFDKQLDHFDEGASYRLSFDLDPGAYAGYLISSAGRFQYDKIDPRTMEAHRANVKIEKAFSAQTRNYLAFSYSRIKRDFYFNSDSPGLTGLERRYQIESRSDNIIAVSDSLRYAVSNELSWSLFGAVFSREIKRASTSALNPGSDINELRIDGGLRATYQIHPRLGSTLSFSYQEKDEKHKSGAGNQIARQEERRNNFTRRSGLGGILSWLISESDTFFASGSMHLLRYDTPSRENDDDRDEMMYLLNLSARHRLSASMNFRLDADLNFSHLVYLFSSRSADNSWNRIIRLAPLVEYQPFGNFRTTNQFEVLANYTVYDFEPLSAQVQSYAFRQFGFIDSSSLAITKRLRADWFSHVRLYERGELRWKSFSERPINYFEEKTYLGSLSYSFDSGLLFSVGIRYFNQVRYGYSGPSRSLENSLESVGPTTKVEILVGRTSFLIYGWYERQTQTGQPNRGYATMTMALDVKI